MITPVNLDWKKQGWLKQLVDRAVHSVEFTKGRTNVLIKRWPFNLNAAGRQTVDIAGNFVYGLEGTDVIATVSVQFSRRDSDQDLHPITQGLGYIHPFDKLHFSWDAQPDKTLTVIIGNLAPELFAIVDNRSAAAQAALLQEIIDELRGDLAPENMAAVPVNAAATQIVAANANRRSVIVGHRHDGVGFIYVGFTNAVTANIHIIRLAPDECYSTDDYRGAIWAIRSGAATNAIYGEV